MGSVLQDDTQQVPRIVEEGVGVRCKRVAVRKQRAGRSSGHAILRDKREVYVLNAPHCCRLAGAILIFGGVRVLRKAVDIQRGRPPRRVITVEPARRVKLHLHERGGRVKMNGWDDRIELIKSQPVALTSARDKKPFEVTPLFPRLTRIDSGDKD